jgi:hypothetical protein
MSTGLLFWLKALFGVDPEGALHILDKEYYASDEEYSLIIISIRPVCFLESSITPDKPGVFSQEHLGMVVVIL